jgi:DNA-binding NarL/FixJ family response regulator
VPDDSKGSDVVGEQTRIRVVIVDDNAVIRLGLGQLLGNIEDIAVVAEAADGEQAVAAVEAHAPDVVLLDVRMPGRLDGVTVAGLVSDRTAVVMMTYSDEPDVVAAAVRAGARGFLVHGDTSPPQIVAAVRDAAAGRPVFSTRADVALLALVRGTAATAPAVRPEPADPDPYLERELARSGPVGGPAGLSPRENEILAMMSEGLDNTAIAKALVLSRHTVKNHITRIFTKLGVRTRNEAIALWWHHDDLRRGPRTG